MGGCLIPMVNVVADLKGSGKPDEFVVVGGHIDSWDGARGTVDNGTGCATTLEAARILSTVGARPRRTIRFMLWSGEEQGLLGSKAYVFKHQAAMDRYSAVLVHDGGTNYASGILATKALEPIFQELFKPVMELDPEMPFKIHPAKKLVASGGSDHVFFLRAGVPGFFWKQAGRANYAYAHHTQHDLMDQAVPEYQRHTALVVAITAYRIANLEKILPRDDIDSRGGLRGPRKLGVTTDKGVIRSISKNGAADKAGLLEGDRILKLDGRDVKNRDSLRNAIAKSKKKAILVIEREGKRMELKVAFDR